MSEVFNIKEYQLAKKIVPQIDGILKIVNLSIKGLQLFRSYIPVVVILTTLQEQKVILEIHQKRYKRVLDSRGKI